MHLAQERVDFTVRKASVLIVKVGKFVDTDKCTELAVLYICPSVEKKRVRLLETPVSVLSAVSEHKGD